MVACFGRNLVLNSNPNALRSPMTLKTCLWIAAGFVVMGLIGLNGYYARHPVFVSPHRDLLHEALGRLDECERKVSSALPEETFIHVLEGTSEIDNGIRAERQLLFKKDSAALLKRLQEACAPLRTEGRLRTEIEIEKGHDGWILKMVVSSQV
ncbi:hypothetical protein [Prosthecobacter sp.]|uniref:hypothetical protein n=1 Tax=Prosthecobacter sp. TaxID=1965333 RepID=UPI0037C5614B